MAPFEPFARLQASYDALDTLLRGVTADVIGRSDTFSRVSDREVGGSADTVVRLALCTVLTLGAGKIDEIEDD